MLSELQVPQELQVSQLERYDSSVLRREVESALFAIPLGLSRHRYSKETLRAVLDARCIVDGNIQEAARWPTECQVRSNIHRADVAHRFFLRKNLYTESPIATFFTARSRANLDASSELFLSPGDPRKNPSH